MKYSVEHSLKAIADCKCLTLFSARFQYISSERLLHILKKLSDALYFGVGRACPDKIVAKGKSKKLALIAVCNKLLKQAFSIVKNCVPYKNEYRSTLIKK